MKKLLLLILCSQLCITGIRAQLTHYNQWEGAKTAVFQVEDMESDEIKDYNRLIAENGLDSKQAIVLINAARAVANMECAPATIIKIYSYPEIFDGDSHPEAVGGRDIQVELINTTPKTIKEMTLELEFNNQGKQVYDIKTGDPNCILKFENLKGRTKSGKYEDIYATILESYHCLKTKDASFVKYFHNIKATETIIKRVSIKYEDGSVSNAAAIFNSDDMLLEEGPLKPLVDTESHFNLNANLKRQEIPRVYSGKVWDVVEQQPSFPGGYAALMSWLANNIRYPQEVCGQGRVVVSFVVEPDGSISNVQVVRSVDPSFDKEAVRVTKAMPRWIPGKQNGKAVRVKYNLPVTFRLN